MRRTCLRCGHESDSQVRMRLVRYDTGKPFGAEWRCVDTAACDRRAKENE